MSLIINPSTLTPSAWYVADDVTGVDGATVASWTDASTAGRTLVQASTSGKPKVYLDMANEYRAILFDGTDDYMATTTGSSGLVSTILGTNGIGTSIVVFAETSTGSTGGLWGENNTSGTQLYLSLDTTPGTSISVVQTTGTSGSSSASVYNPLDLGACVATTELKWHVGCWQHTTSGSVIVGMDDLDSVAVSSSTAGTDGGLATNLLVGKSSKGFFKGYMLELLFFSTVLTETQRRGVQLYLTDKYGIAYGSGTTDEGRASAPIKVEMKLSTSTLQLSPSAWYKADAITGSSDGAALTTWEDQSGNNYDITESTNKPTYQTNEVNGLPAVLFDGSNDMLAGTVTLSQLFKANGYGTVYAVVKPVTAGGAHDHLLWSGAGAGTPTRMTGIEDGAAAIVLHGYNYDGTQDDATGLGASLGAWNVWCWMHYIDSYLYAGCDNLDWASLGSAASGPTTDLANVLNVGGQATLGDYFKGYIAELMFFDAAHTQVQRRHVHAYLAEKYGLTYPYSSEYEPMFVDVTSDVRGVDGLTFSYGMDGSDATDRVAASGSASFSMENSAANSGAVVGYYSPDSASKRPGFKIGAAVRLSFEYYSTRYYKWLGQIVSLDVVPGKMNHVVRVNCSDYMDEMARTMIGDQYTKPSVMTNTRADLIMQTLLIYVPRLPTSSVLGRGSDTYPYALDNMRDEDITLLAEFQRIALSELGYIYLRGDTYGGGRLVLEPRGIRPSFTAVRWAMTSADIMGLTLAHSMDDIINRCTVTVHPRRIDTDTSVLWSIGSTATQIPAGETYRIDVGFRDPNDDRSTRIGGYDMVTPAAYTDYAMSDITDSVDMTGDLAVGDTYGANSAFLTLVNGSTDDGYVTKLQVRGKGLYAFETYQVDVQSSDSINTYGPNVYKIDMPYQQSMRLAHNAAAFLVQNNADPKTKVRSVTFLANASSVCMMHALNREPGDRISITEDTSGLSADEYFIQRVTFDVQAGGLATVSWTLIPTSMETALA